MEQGVQGKRKRKPIAYGFPPRSRQAAPGRHWSDASSQDNLRPFDAAHLRCMIYAAPLPLAGS